MYVTQKRRDGGAGVASDFMYLEPVSAHAHTVFYGSVWRNEGGTEGCEWSHPLDLTLERWCCKGVSLAAKRHLAMHISSMISIHIYGRQMAAQVHHEFIAAGMETYGMAGKGTTDLLNQPGKLAEQNKKTPTRSYIRWNKLMLGYAYAVARGTTRELIQADVKGKMYAVEARMTAEQRQIIHAQEVAEQEERIRTRGRVQVFL